MPIYGLDIGKNLIQVYTTTEVLTILQEAIDNQSLAGLDPSIAPVITAVKESNGNNNITFWLGTEAEFNALGITAKQIFARVDATGKLYLCTDDSTLDDWLVAAKAEITGDVADDITRAQTTADNAILRTTPVRITENILDHFSDDPDDPMYWPGTVTEEFYMIGRRIYGKATFSILPDGGAVITAPEYNPLVSYIPMTWYNIGFGYKITQLAYNSVFNVYESPAPTGGNQDAAYTVYFDYFVTE